MQDSLQVQQYIIYYPIAIIVMAFCVASLLSAKLTQRRTPIVAIFGILFFLVNIYILNYPGGSDFAIFRNAGIALLEGVSPYTDPAMVSPPTALPLFALMAKLPFSVSLFVWTTINVCIGLALALLSQRALQSHDVKFLPAPLLSLLTATVVFSLPIYWSIGLGQLALFETFCLLSALYAQRKNWPMLAGVALGLATIKPQTMLPFLLLFLRKSDFRIWISFVLIVCILCIASLSIASGSLHTFPLWIYEALRNISSLAAPGAWNDYSFDAPYYHTIVGIDYALYCLGLRDRAIIRIIQIIILGVIGFALAIMNWRKVIPRGGVCALVAIYAFIFLYHRFHDASILTLPLVYAWSRVLSSNKPQRSLFIAAFIALLPILFVHPKFVQLAVQYIPSEFGLLKGLAQAVFLPYAIWCALIAMGLLYKALRTPVPSTMTKI